MSTNDVFQERLSQIQEQYVKNVQSLVTNYQNDMATLKAELEERAKTLEANEQQIQQREKNFDERIEQFTKKVSASQPITLNVGGTIICTRAETILSNEPESIFTPMLSGNFAVDKDDKGAIFFDRSGQVFLYLMEFLRNGSIRVLDKIQECKKSANASMQCVCVDSLATMELIEEEAKFFGFEKLLKKYFSCPTSKGNFTFEQNNLQTITQSITSWQIFKVAPFITLLPAKISFSITAVNAADSNSWKFIVGVIVSDSTFTAGNWLGFDSNGYGYGAPGCFVHNTGGEQHKYGQTYGVGDVIEVALDQQYNLSFKKNGLDFGIAMKLPARAAHAAPYAFAMSTSSSHTICIV